ncbi:MAG TPA: primosomal protein N' [Burkholderiales bacterium]|nr:primosomal protein N' [Burkholderiales bacterium]
MALEVPLPRLFEYTLPAGSSAACGDRVTVQLGRRNHTGVVIDAEVASELGVERLKSIVDIRSDAPRLPPDWLELMRFLSSYYQRPLGETVVAALPPRLRSLKPLPRKSVQAAQEPGSTTFVRTHALTSDQQRVVDTITGNLGRFGPVLLHGITGSGKTEVYLNLIAKVIESGAQALVLVPEISLTPQLEARFREAFPDARIVMMHSGLEDVARTSAWLEAARGTASIVLGTRLAVLAPMAKVGLIVVDEEHDSSFKQQEGLRYSARDAAVYRAKLSGCPVILGSATPSLESWYNYRQGRYERLVLTERASAGAQLPVVRMVDLRNQPVEHGFAAPVLEAITRRLSRGEQSLVFINRRGYAPVLACEACGWCAACARCTGRLVLHATDRRLRCHHCGGEHAIPRECPTCGNVDLKAMGRGTQRVEETLIERFPGARIVRIDRDSARRRGELSQTLEAIRRGEGDILVGTQLLAKGHDFPNLTFVAVLNADHALLSTDYRASERLFSVLSQVAGRAGRRSEPGEVMVQTRYPDHPLFAALARHDFAGFAESELAARQSAGFPPCVFEAALRAEAEELSRALAFLNEARALVEAPPEVKVFDPVPHVMTRRAGFERAQLVMQSASRLALQDYLARLSAVLYETAPRAVRWHLDVDPIEFD